MKRLTPLLFSLMFLLSACGGSGQAQPTAIGLPTAIPTQAVTVTETPRPAEGKAGDTRTVSTDGMIQVFVPAGTFRMGGLDNNAQSDEQPARTVTLDAFWLDKVEVTNGMYDLCVKAGACDAPSKIQSATRERYFGNPDFNNYPVIYVNWLNASKYCTWAGRRLPTEAEWEYAARGGDYRTYPWGDEAPSKELANFNYLFKDTTQVGMFANSLSPFGALDMAGNVWEWTADFYSATYYSNNENNNPGGPASAGVNGPRRSIRGGSFVDSEKDLRLANRGYALAPNPDADPKSNSYAGETGPNIGFRCASDN